MADKKGEKKKYPRGPSKNPNRAHKPGVRAIPLGLTEEILEDVVKLTKEGVPLSLIRAKYAFSEDTWYSWLHRGRQELVEYRAGNIKESDLSLKARLVQGIGEAETECFRELLKFEKRDSFRFMEKRFGKHFESQKEIDQETGKEKDISNDQLISSILSFLPKPKDPTTP